MSMNNVFHPGVRKWISDVFNVGEEAAKLQNTRDEFMDPIDHLPDSKALRKEKLRKVEEQEALEKEKLKMSLFGPKPKGRPKKIEIDETEDSEEDDDDSDSLSNDGFPSDDGLDTYSDEEDVDDFKKKVRSRKSHPNDDMYMFASESESEESDDADSPHVAVEDPLEPLLQQGLSQPQQNFPLSAAEMAEKDKKEFKLFYDQVRDHAERVANLEIQNDREDMVNLMMMEQGMTREKAEAEYKHLSALSNPYLATSLSEVIVEAPLIKGSEMPLLAGPIPNEALQAQGALALYAGLSDEPGNFQYRMGHVVDLLTTQVQGSLGILRDEGLEREDQVERVFERNEVIITISTYQPWKEMDDLLTELKTIPEPDFGFEIEILGSNTVADLCSMFRCQSDLVCTKEFEYPILPPNASEALALCEPFLTKNVNPWHAIFIQDTIYVNFDESAKEFRGLRDIQAWAARHEKNDGIKEIKISSKMDTKLSELNIQMGYPYVYIHQSTNCEHLFCFTTIRLPRKNVEYSVFPKYNSIGKFPTKYCVVDNEILARWAVVDCVRLPQNPMFLCTDCVKAYCYSRKNSKERTGEFKLHPYFQLVHHFQ